MNVIEAATALGITPSTVRDQAGKGVLTASKRGRVWDIAPADVERYRTAHRGNRARPNMNARTPEMEALRLAGLRRQETKRKMRAAKLGGTLTPEHRAKVSEALHRRVVRPETRQKHSLRQQGVPKSPEHRAAIQRAARTDESRAKRSAATVARYLSGQRPYSAIERRAADLLLPLGYQRFPTYDGHAFDFGRGATVIEVNGCGVHHHRTEKPTCSWQPYGTRGPGANARYRQIAAAHGLTLIELWACEKPLWPGLVPE